jgi:hypothetical protein
MSRSDTPRKAQFHWDDPLLLNEQLNDEERMVRDAAAAYCQDKLKPRVLEAFRHETMDTSIFPDDSRTVRRPRPELRQLRPDRARSRARRFRLPLDDERAILAGDGPDLRVRQ